jgi:hypothetical protein
MPGRWSEGGACGRRCKPLPGSFGHQHPSTTDWAARCSLDEGQVRAGNTRNNCVRFCPRNGDRHRPALRHVPGSMAWSWAFGMRSPLGQSRGGTPIDVRILLGARPCQQHGRLDNASVGVPLPFLMLGERGVADSEKAGTTPSFPSATLFFALQPWRQLQNSGADAPGERERLP